jgi:hypothetical protein
MIYQAANLAMAFRVIESKSELLHVEVLPTEFFSVVRTLSKLELVKALIPQAVLLPIREGQKRPTLSNWSKTTYAKTQLEWYQVRLKISSNIGVLLGTNSNGLCSIDLDSDEDAELFLEANPKLRKSLITKGRRGLNVWVNVIDDWPKLQRFDWGEWRSDGGQTVISGIHPEGMPYRFISEKPPIEVLFSDIKWPFEQQPKRAEVLHNIEFLIELEEREEKEGETSLATLYSKYVEPYIKPLPGTRNKNIVHSLSFLFFNVSPSIAHELGMMIYDKHSSIWNDTRDRHEYECAHLLRGIEASYHERIPPKAQSVYEVLDGQARIAFRICFSLSRSKNNNHFFLSARELQSRMGLPAPMSALRILKRLEAKGAIKEAKKGSMVGMQASTYRWLLKGKLKEKEPLQKDAA